MAYFTYKIQNSKQFSISYNATTVDLMFKYTNALVVDADSFRILYVRSFVGIVENTILRRAILRKQLFQGVGIKTNYLNFTWISNLGLALFMIIFTIFMIIWCYCFDYNDTVLTEAICFRGYQAVITIHIFCLELGFRCKFASFNVELVFIYFNFLI